MNKAPLIYIACCACIYIWIRFPWKNLRFRNVPVLVFFVDLLLWPFMKLGASGKITHWWDWEPVSLSEIDPEIRPLMVESRTPQQRIYKVTKRLGRYNWEGIRDLHKTLFRLQEVVVLEPESYRGFWRLLIAGNRYQDEKQYDLYLRVDLLIRGRVKTLLDGRKLFLGQTEDGQYIPLKLVEQTSRDRYKDLPFV